MTLTAFLETRGYKESDFENGKMIPFEWLKEFSENIKPGITYGQRAGLIEHLDRYGNHKYCKQSEGEPDDEFNSRKKYFISFAECLLEANEYIDKHLTI